MKLFISQQFKPTHLPPLVLKIRKALEGTKRGKLLNTFQVAASVRCCVGTVRGLNGFLEGYFHVWKGKKYWGNKATIAYFKRETQKDVNS